MPDPNRQSEMPSSAASSSPDWEAFAKWLRGLSAAELEEFAEAIANHDGDRLARFDTRLQTYLDRSVNIGT
jgi:hypothetical protein